MSKSPKESRSFIGIDDFLRFIHDGEPEWAVITVKAPIDAAVEILSELRHADKRFPGIPVRKATDEVEEVAPGICILQLKANPWVVVYISLFFLAPEDIHLTFRDASELSKRLNTSAFAFFAHDIADSPGYRFFENGVPQKCSPPDIVESGVNDSAFPDICSADDEALTEITREKGIYLPCCHPANNGDSYWIATYPPYAPIERADLIVLRR